MDVQTGKIKMGFAEANKAKYSKSHGARRLEDEGYEIVESDMRYDGFEIRYTYLNGSEDNYSERYVVFSCSRDEPFETKK